MNNFVELHRTNITEPEKKLFREERRHLLLWGGISASLMAIALSLYQGLIVFLIMVPLTLFGFVYGLNIVPLKWQKLGFRKLQDIPGSKEIFTAFGWSMVVAGLPFIRMGKIFEWSSFLSFGVVSLIVFLRTFIVDLKDAESDSILGNETMITILKKQNINIVLYGLAAAYVFFIMGGIFLDVWIFKSAMVLVLAFFYLVFLKNVAARETFFKNINFEILIDFSLYIPLLLFVF